jgi:hypothetical protein
MKLLNRKPLPRRLFLKGIGGATLALPFLEASVSKAATVTVPKRFVVWYTPCGSGASSYPTSMNFSGTPYAALQPFADNLLITRGIAMKSISGQSTPPHPTGFGHMLTGNKVSLSGDDILSAQNASIDMFIASRMDPTQVSASQHGVVNMRNMSWYQAPSGAVSSARAEQDPNAAFKRLFANVSTGNVSDTSETSDAEATPGADDKKNLRRISILDAVRNSYKDLTCRVGGEDRKRLEAHFDYVRDMESRIPGAVVPGGIAGGAAGGGIAPIADSCTVPGSPGNFNVGSIAAGRDIARAHMSVLSSALACDITRVGTLQWYSHTAVYGSSYGWADGSHHASSHEGKTAKYDQLYAEELARFLGLLKDGMAEDGSSLLDHTAVLCISELGISGQVHHLADLPIMIAGSAGGYLKTGQYIDLLGSNRSGFTRAPDWKAQSAPSEYFRPFDVSHNDLFVELANAVAPPGAEPVKTFGRADMCTGGVPRLRA